MLVDSQFTTVTLPYNYENRTQVDRNGPLRKMVDFGTQAESEGRVPSFHGRRFAQSPHMYSLSSLQNIFDLICSPFHQTWMTTTLTWRSGGWT